MEITTLIRQRIIFIGLLVIIFLLTTIRHWIRIIFLIPLIIGAIFTLGTIIFPLYEDGPNLTIFYKTQNSTVFFTSTATDKVIIKNSINLYELDGQINVQQTLPNNLETTISFVASSTTGGSSCILLLPEGTSIEISPQSQLIFLSQYPKINVEKKQGIVKYIPSRNSSPRQLILSGITIQEKEKNTIQQQYEKNKISEIQNQGGGIFMQNPYLKSINIALLNILAKLHPQKFEDNLIHLQAFEEYQATDSIRKTDTSIDPNIQTDIINQAKRGWEETKLYQRRKELFK